MQNLPDLVHIKSNLGHVKTGQVPIPTHPYIQRIERERGRERGGGGGGLRREKTESRVLLSIKLQSSKTDCQKKKKTGSLN